MAYTRTFSRFVSARRDWTINKTSGKLTVSQLYSDVTSGHSNPKYRALIKSGRGVVGTYSRDTIKVGKREPLLANGTAYSVNPAYPDDVVTVSGDFLPTLVAQNNLSVAAVEAEALAKTYKRISEQQTHFNALQFVGELRDTIKMLKHPFQGVSTLVSRYVDQVSGYHHLLYNPRVSVLTKRRLLKTAAASWLEVAFGIRPLLSDTKDLAETIARFQNDTRRNLVSANVVHRQQQTNTSTLEAQYGMLYVRKVEKSLKQARVRYKVAVGWTNSAEFHSASRLSELCGFRVDLFVPTLYELVPWSWLLDYFSNLGDVIETGCAAITAVDWGVRSESRETVNTAYFSADTNGAANTSYFSTTGSAEITRKTFNRTPVTSLQSVQLVFDFPNQATKYANILAAWATKLKP